MGPPVLSFAGPRSWYRKPLTKRTFTMMLCRTFLACVTLTTLITVQPILRCYVGYDTASVPLNENKNTEPRPSLPACECAPFNATSPSSSKITPQIIQTFKEPFAKLPPGMKQAASTWKDLNPEYIYRYFDDADILNYVHQNHGKILSLYLAATSGAMRSDIFRALIIYREGGIYADIDTVLKRPLREILRPDDGLVSGVGQAHDLHQWFLAYSPCHPILGRLLEQLSSLHPSQLKTTDTLWVAGPNALHRAASEVLGQDHTTFQFQPNSMYFVPHDFKRHQKCHSDTNSICTLGGDLLDGSIQFKYEGYLNDLRGANVTYWLDNKKARNLQLKKH